MGWVSILAIYFVIWWTVLFAVLPFGVRTQDDEGDVTLGTTPSAPQTPRMARVVIRTTIVAAIVFGVFYLLTVILGLDVDDIPRIVPQF